MKASVIKYPVCLFAGHILDTPSIIEFIDSGNYLKKCSRCGLYHARSTYGFAITISKRVAVRWKRAFDEEFGWLRQLVKEGDNDG